MVFFDTAGNLPSGCGAPVSIVAARPRRVVKGSIFREEDVMRLEGLLAEGVEGGVDVGYPLGGWCGWVEYEGDFCFGDYPEMLVYDHRSGMWHEVGDLSAEWLDGARQEWRRDEGWFQGGWCEEMGEERFVEGVERIREWIAAGDIYQVNLAQGYRVRMGGGSLFGLYEHLREASPAPLAAYLHLDGREVLSSSPETFLRVSGRLMETRPIKGTRPRHEDPDEDRRSAYELQTSPKEIAELVMITDLLRNDLGQVCEYGSVWVEEMLKLETLGQVHHLVSTVKGTMREGCGPVEALARCFPGGSITGAPKKRAMEIIRELEGVPRGLYCGAVGYFGYHGESQFSIVIRTLIREGGEMRYQVGAGIVADSDPVSEYEETQHKARGIRMALERWGVSGRGGCI